MKFGPRFLFAFDWWRKAEELSF